MNELAAQLKQKPIAIFGMGVSGQGAYALAKLMGFETTLFDEQEIEHTRQSFTLADAHMHSGVILSPGFSEAHPWVLLARKAGIKILSELDFGGLFLTHGVYAVTGTNGKTTTCAFLKHTLTAAGRIAVDVGNNGVSLCQWLADNFDERTRTEFVVEISSFQAEKINHLPIEGLIWTTFGENHLDYHQNIKEYFDAKWRLVTEILPKSKNKLFVCGKSVFEMICELGYQLPDNAFVVDNQPLNEFDTLPAGTVFDHRPFDEDFRMLMAFGERIGIPRIIWHEAARTFSLPAHRLSLSTQIGEVAFFNDAKSTTFDSTLAAMERFQNRVLWIGGGKSKGGDLENFARRLANKVKEAFLIGQTSEKMSILLQREGIPANYYASLDEAVQAAAQQSRGGDVILFSPGFSSLDQFKNFVERGNFFEKSVFELQQTLDRNTKA